MGIFAQSVKENAIIRRQKTEQKRDTSKVQLAIKEIINKLKKEKTWQKISADVICREYDIPAQLRYVFLHDFESNPNILSKPAQNSTDKTKIADSIPMEYKYVPKKEKQRLKYTANCFKLIQTNTLDSFRERLDKHKDDVPIYDKLIILNELLRYEANKGFKRLSIYAILTFSFKVPFSYMETKRTLPQLSLGESKYVHKILIPLIFYAYSKTLFVILMPPL